MPTINYIPNVTVISSSWLNEVDALLFDVFLGAQTAPAALAALGLAPLTQTPVGTLSLPSFAYGPSDSDTGIYHPSLGTVALVSDGAETIRASQSQLAEFSSLYTRGFPTATSIPPALTGLGVDDLYAGLGQAVVKGDTLSFDEPAKLIFVAHEGTIAAPIANDDVDELMALEAYGYDGADYILGARISAVVAGSPAVGAMPTRLRFSTCSPTGALLGAMVIDENQNIRMGLNTLPIKLSVNSEGSSNNVIDPSIAIENTFTSTVLPGFGPGMVFRSSTTTGGNVVTTGVIETPLTTVAFPAATADMVFGTLAGGTLVRNLKLNSTGLGIELGSAVVRAGVHVAKPSRQIAITPGSGAVDSVVLESLSSGILRYRTYNSAFSIFQENIIFSSGSSTTNFLMNLPGPAAQFFLNNGTTTSSAPAQLVNRSIVGSAVLEASVSGVKRTSGTPAAGLGVRHAFVSDTDTSGNEEVLASIDAVLTSVASGAEAASIDFRTLQSGATASRFSIGQGLFSQGVAGGDKGAGSANFGSLFVNNVQILPAGAFVWVDQTGSRSLNTDFQNLTGHDLDVSVVVGIPAGDSAALRIGPTTGSYISIEETASISGSGHVGTVHAVVPPSHFFRVATTGAVSLTRWLERL